MYDWFFMNNDTAESIKKRIKATDVYSFSGELIEIRIEKEMALYFPYLIATGCWHKDLSERSRIYLSDTDYIRMRELETVRMYVEIAKKAKALFERVGKKFSTDAVYRDRFAWRGIGGKQDEDKEQIREIITGVGNGITKFDDIRLPSLSAHRDIWLKDLVNIYGYNEEFAKNWVYHRKKG